MPQALDQLELESLTEAGLRPLVETQPRWSERYEGWTKIGSGSFATVVRTYSRKAGHDIAVKVFHHRLDRRRFEQEVHNAKLLASDYTVRIGAHSWGAPAWIEMEYVDGPTLKQELDRRADLGEPFRIEEALDIGIALATVLRDAHRHTVVHRDVKPANILLPRSGTPPVKLIDFGVSRCEGQEGSTLTGTFRGTPQFGSPEAFVGEDPLGPKHDIYALGLCLYMVFTAGQFPWRIRKDANACFFMGLHLNMPPTSARIHVPALDPDLDYLLQRCLAKLPRERPAAHQVLEALELVRRRYPAGKRPVPAAQPRLDSARKPAARAVASVAAIIEELERAHLDRGR